MLKHEFLSAAIEGALSSTRLSEAASPEDNRRLFETDKLWDRFPDLVDVLAAFAGFENGGQTLVTCCFNKETGNIGIDFKLVNIDIGTLFVDPKPFANILVQEKNGVFSIVENIMFGENRLPRADELVSDFFSLRADGRVRDNLTRFQTEKEAAVHLARLFGRMMPRHLVIESAQRLQRQPA